MSNFKAVRIFENIFVTVDVQDDGTCLIVDHHTWRRSTKGHVEDPIVNWYPVPDRPCVETYDKFNRERIFCDLVEVGTHLPINDKEWQEMKRRAKIHSKVPRLT